MKDEIKKGDIVVLIRERRVAEVTFVRKNPYPYCVRFLSDYVGCAGVYSKTEIKLASSKVKKKYTKAFIAELFGPCLKKGCSMSC